MKIKSSICPSRNTFIRNSKSFQMSLNKRFEEAAYNQTIKISSMEIDRKYPITHAERLTTVTGHGPCRERYL
jgi:hypothetical protein